ncbi:hypothetical protein [Fodinicurvata sp. EGI_FJ10296]|uniref:hypothetical protein n=1 Tax=Fodinicurvata sp. EGI_FJ10296 TaxID=3231908 RepID=UPI003456BF5E
MGLPHQCRISVQLLTAAVLLLLAAPGAKADDGSDSEAIQDALDRTRNGGTVHLNAREYRLTSPLRLQHDNATLIGQGPEQTILYADFEGDDIGVIEIHGQLMRDTTPSNCVALHGDRRSSDDQLETDVALAARHSGSSLAIRARNTEDFLQSIGSQVWNEEYPMIRQTLVIADAIDSKFIQLDRPLGLDVPDGARVCPIDLVEDVILRDLTIVYDAGFQPDPTEYENTAPTNRVDGVSIQGALRPRIENVTVYNAGRHPFNLDNVLDARLRAVSAFGAYNKGAGGNGYFRLARTYHSRIDGLVARGLRHLAIQWSSYGNSLAGVDSDTDINFHGGHVRNNQVIVDSLTIRPGHPWGEVFVTPDDADWAPPDGPGNVVVHR